MKIKTNIVAHNKISVVVSTSLLQNTCKTPSSCYLSTRLFGSRLYCFILNFTKIIVLTKPVREFNIYTKVFYPKMKKIKIWKMKKNVFEIWKMFLEYEKILVECNTWRSWPVLRVLCVEAAPSSRPVSMLTMSWTMTASLVRKHFSTSLLSSSHRQVISELGSRRSHSPMVIVNTCLYQKLGQKSTSCLHIERRNSDFLCVHCSYPN